MPSSEKQKKIRNIKETGQKKSSLPKVRRKNILTIPVGEKEIFSQPESVLNSLDIAEPLESVREETGNGTDLEVSQINSVEPNFTDSTILKPGKFKFTSRQGTILIAVPILILVIGFMLVRIVKEQNQDAASRVLGVSAVVDPAEKARQDAKDLLEKISSLVTLPENDQPTIATVVDLEPLKDQAFFENAFVGDKTLVYEHSGKAYLYRPSENKIIEFGLFEPTPTEVNNLSIEIRNGSELPGMAFKLKEHLSQFKNYEFVAIGNASKKYMTGKVVDLSRGKYSKAAQSLSEYLKLPLESILPEGEKSSKAEVLVIIGEK